MLVAPTEGEDLVADYASLGLTLGRHPLALLREHLQRQRMHTAAELKTLPHGRLARVTGLVTGRQRPGTASASPSFTLEDETGMVNVIVWRDLADRQRKELLRSSLMSVYGTLEREGEVVHLIAGRLRDQTATAGESGRTLAGLSLAARAPRRGAPRAAWGSTGMRVDAGRPTRVINTACRYKEA